MCNHTGKGLGFRAAAIVGTLIVAAGATFGMDEAPTSAPAAASPEAAPVTPPFSREAMAKIALWAEIGRQAQAGVMPMPCFINDPTPEQLAGILNRFGAHPPSEFLGNQPRFWTATTQWNSNGSGNLTSGQASRATLTYSFIPDGTSWFDCNGGPNTGSGLIAKFTTAFGAGNEDRGRELWRQGQTGWRKWCGLIYNEVSDDGSAWTNSTTLPATRGTIRIGGTSETASGGTGLGILACNNFPPSGSDQSINIDWFDGSHFLNTTNNYRYFRNVIGHEHGHGLGAGHPVPCDNTKLMEPFINVNFDLLQVDDMRFGQRDYGDRFAGNNTAANALNFGDLTSPAVRSVIEKNLSTNGSAGSFGTNNDWFRFTLSSPQSVTITVAPVGGSYLAGTQSSGCSGTTTTVNSGIAGNLNAELYQSDGTTLITAANSQPAGSTETITLPTLAAGTYTLRVVDVGPNTSSDQIVQLYNLTIRVGTSFAPPKAVAGLNKRCTANLPCWFYGNINSYATEVGASLSTYQWDLDGDGTFDSTLTPTSTTYVSNAVFNVKLRVTDSNGQTNDDTITVTVTGATGLVTPCSPILGNQGAVNLPVTINGKNLRNVTSLGQIAISGTGITIGGTPTPNLRGTQVSGLTFTINNAAPLGTRDITITNSDGQGNGASGNGAFTVVGAPPSNDDCSSPSDLGSTTGSIPVDNSTANSSATPTPSGCGNPVNNDIWFKWTAPAAGAVQINGSSGTYPPRVGVYSGLACPPGVAIGCSEFGGLVNLNVSGGDVLLIQYGSTGSVVGPGSLFIGFTPITIACCYADGSCQNQLSADCTSGGGSPQNAGSVCTPNPCPQPPVACCFADGSCTDLTAAACTTQGGTPGAAGSACATTACPQPSVACCFSDGSCQLLTAANCTSGGGTPQAFGSVCLPNTCPQPGGTCCWGSICQTNVLPANCTGPNHFFAGGANCNASGDLKTPCCKADYNHANGITVQDIFDYLAAWFGKDITADINGAVAGPGAGNVTVQDIFDFLSAWFAKGCG